jgi:hypothetical protein
LKGLTKGQIEFLHCVEPKRYAPEREREAKFIAVRWDERNRHCPLMTTGAAEARLRRLEARGYVTPNFNGSAPTRWYLTAEGMKIVPDPGSPRRVTSP